MVGKELTGWHMKSQTVGRMYIKYGVLSGAEDLSISICNRDQVYFVVVASSPPPPPPPPC